MGLYAEQQLWSKKVDFLTVKGLAPGLFRGITSSSTAFQMQPNLIFLKKAKILKIRNQL